MVDWTKGGECSQQTHCGELNAKYWVELLLLQHVSRPFSFVHTTNISTHPSPPVYVQGLSSAKGRVVVAINTKSFGQDITIVGGRGKVAYTICLESGTGPAMKHALTADRVALPPFATMFVVWS
jgi:hypothetical protein